MMEGLIVAGGLGLRCSTERCRDSSASVIYFLHKKNPPVFGGKLGQRLILLPHIPPLGENNKESED